MVKNLLAKQETRETQVRSLGWKDPLEKGRQYTPVFLTEELHGQRSLAGHSPRGHKQSDTTEQLSMPIRDQNTQWVPWWGRQECREGLGSDTEW